MIINNKNIQSSKHPQFSLFNNKIHHTPYQTLKLKSTSNRFLQPKKYSRPRQNNNFITNQNSNQSTNKNSLSQSTFFNNQQLSHSLQQNEDQNKEQTFKDFIRKIQSYNQNHIVKQNHSLINERLSQNSAEQENIGNPLKQNLKNSCISHKQEEQTLILKSKKSTDLGQSQKLKKFIINNKMSKSFYTREYRRSKTQQQINLQKIDFSENNILDETQSNKNNLIYNSTIQKTISKLNALNITKSPLKYVDIRLVQQNKIDGQNFVAKQFLQTKISLESQINQSKNNNIMQKSMQNPNVKGENKQSKIRIRFGSTLYNKNFSTIEASHPLSKLRFKKDLQNSPGTIHNKRKMKPSLNSQFCQNKIVQAQNVFIQKRRLLPTAEIKTRQQLVKPRKQFFTLSNSFDKYKKPKAQINLQVTKGQNINGWQFNEQGPINYKIQQFF